MSYISLHLSAYLLLKICIAVEIHELFGHLKNWHLTAQQMAQQ